MFIHPLNRAAGGQELELEHGDPGPAIIEGGGRSIFYECHDFRYVYQSRRGLLAPFWIKFDDTHRETPCLLSFLPKLDIDNL